jgi:hypothetical protein
LFIGIIGAFQSTDNVVPIAAMVFSNRLIVGYFYTIGVLLVCYNFYATMSHLVLLIG